MKRGGGTGGKRTQAKELRGLGIHQNAGPQPLQHQGPVPGRGFFSMDLRVGPGWFGDDSRALHLLCTLFLSLLHQLHLISSGIRS